MVDRDTSGSAEPDDWVTDPLDPPSPRAPSEPSTATTAVDDDTRPLGSATVPPPPEPTRDEIGGLRYDESEAPFGGMVAPRAPAPDVPSPISARYLFPTEKYRGEWRRHWIHLMPQFVIGVLSTFIMGYVSGLLAKSNSDAAMAGVVAAWLIVLAYVGWKLLDWYFDRFILTNKRVMVVSGVVTKKVAMMPLLRVTDMKYEQSPLGRMLSYGTFVMESAGQDQALREVKHLPDPNELYLQMCEEMYEPEAVEARESENEESAVQESAQDVDSRQGGDA